MKRICPMNTVTIFHLYAVSRSPKCLKQHSGTILIGKSPAVIAGLLFRINLFFRIIQMKQKSPVVRE